MSQSQIRSNQAFTLITGASKGIGKSIAIECAKRKMNLILIARNEALLFSLKESLIENYHIEVECLTLDLLLKNSTDIIFEFINKRAITLNVLINNVGIGCYGNFSTSSLDHNLDVIKLNIEANLKLTHLYLGQIDTANKSYLLNVLSMAAFQPIPNFSIYAASKAFMLSFTKSLQYEQRYSNLSVSALCPGGTDSEFFVDAKMDHIFEKNKRWLMAPSEVASIAIHKMFAGKKIIIPGFYNKLHFILLKIIPETWILYFTSRIYK
ncbi:MAG: SDR family NAD(P)-dependent oxidoreductase [Saprospiraceae bacterium]|nr:SDR family NAD(P)-dependent oxidoreductase [Saprospiraceae bacterium]MBK8450353.1 SDR family NAD(P)-dependent oxidoreductase [Saprospiraceae bacterium]MBK9222796.1 SDR family NAD(P)-dependent oxidoreductase [Saprospiraceae bacterium]